jgi:electron transfer flavoprotein-quinone oxidoreductase
MKNYDVIVVGAGFAGPVAAKKCAEAGLSTLLLERAGRAGEKVQSTASVQQGFIEYMPSWLKAEDAPFERDIYGMNQHFMAGGEIAFTFSINSIIPVVYNLYSFRFTNWEAEQAVKAGVELRTSTAGEDVIKDGDTIVGIVTDKGERLGAKIVIDAEGSEYLLAIKAGVRKKFPPESIELIVSYVFDMPPDKIEQAMGNTADCYWAEPQEKVTHPPGEGTPGLFMIPMRDTIHICDGQILAWNNKQALRADGAQLLQTYFDNLFKTRRWREDFEPHVKLRAKKFATVPLYGNLFEEVIAQPCYASGMLMAGDAGAFQTPIGHGVGPAWISGDIAADVAIEALRDNDVSADYLKTFDERCKAHPLLSWMLTCTARNDLTKIPQELPWIINGVWNLLGELARPRV